MGGLSLVGCFVDVCFDVMIVLIEVGLYMECNLLVNMLVGIVVLVLFKFGMNYGYEMVL